LTSQDQDPPTVAPRSAGFHDPRSDGNWAKIEEAPRAQQDRARAGRNQDRKTTSQRAAALELDHRSKIGTFIKGFDHLEDQGRAGS
jgi:hypothetical protein